jgi:hypothetical protein
MKTMAMAAILAAGLLAALVLGTGCASVQYGPVKVTSFARSSDIKHLEYFEGAPGGTVRALRMEGFQGDGVQGARIGGDIIGAVAGAVAGASAGGPAGAALGGLGGGAIADLLAGWLKSRQGAAVPAAGTSTGPAVVVPVAGGTNATGVIGGLIP